MTAEQDLNWKIHNVRESIGLDLANLASKNLTADRRRAIWEHLNICHSTLKSLKELVGRNRAASQKSKLEQHESLQRQLPLNKAQVGRL